ELGGDPAAALLGGDFEAVAGLDLQVRGARPERLVAAGPGEPAELVLARGPSRLGGRADAAGLVRRARHAGRELGGAVAGEDEVGVAVHEAGDRAAPAGVEALVARGPSPLERRDPPVLHHHRGVAEHAQGPLAPPGLVGHQEPDVVDHERAQAQASRTAASSSPAASRRAWRPSRTTHSPPTITERTSAALAAK